MRPLVSLLLLLILSAPVRLATAQTIYTVAGSGPPPNPPADGTPATNAQLSSVGGVAVDGAGNLFFVALARVYKVDSSGIITTVAGDGTSVYFGDGGPAITGITPGDIAVDSAGNLYIADGGVWIRKVSGGIITTVAGNGTNGYSGDGGQAVNAQISCAGIAIDAAGNLYFTDSQNYRVRRISGGVITTVAGNGNSLYSGDGGAATVAGLSPGAVAVDGAGNLYVVDQLAYRVRKVSPGGIITTVAGDGTSGYSGDGGLATAARLNDPLGLAVDGAGNLYISDYNSAVVRRVTSGIITTVAGNGTRGYSGDGGSALNAQLSPAAVAADSAGNVYVSDSNNSVRKIAGGIITTIAGGGTGSGPLGDGGPATLASLNAPLGVTVDTSGNYYIADTGNNRIRQVSKGIITTVAGNGIAGYSGDGGMATNAQVNQPSRVAVDPSGNLYIADTKNHRVREVSGGVITTLAGTGAAGFTGDGGLATSAALNSPSGVAVDGGGNVYIADTGNNRIRKVSGGVITTSCRDRNRRLHGRQRISGQRRALRPERRGHRYSRESLYRRHTECRRPKSIGRRDHYAGLVAKRTPFWHFIGGLPVQCCCGHAGHIYYSTSYSVTGPL